MTSGKAVNEVDDDMLDAFHEELASSMLNITLERYVQLYLFTFYSGYMSTFKVLKFVRLCRSTDVFCVSKRDIDDQCESDWTFDIDDRLQEAATSRTGRLTKNTIEFIIFKLCLRSGSDYVQIGDQVRLRIGAFIDYISLMTKDSESYTRNLHKLIYQATCVDFNKYCQYVHNDRRRPCNVRSLTNDSSVIDEDEFKLELAADIAAGLAADSEQAANDTAGSTMLN